MIIILTVKYNYSILCYYQGFAHSNVLTVCVCVFVFQPHSFLGGNQFHRTSWFLAAVTGRLKAFSAQSRNPLPASFVTGKAPKICRVSAAVIVLVRGPRTNLGKTRTQRRQKPKFPGYPFQDGLCEKLSDDGSSVNTETYSGMRDLTCWTHVILTPAEISSRCICPFTVFNWIWSHFGFHHFSLRWAFIWILHYSTWLFWYYSRVTDVNYKWTLSDIVCNLNSIYIRSKEPFVLGIDSQSSWQRLASHWNASPVSRLWWGASCNQSGRSLVNDDVGRAGDCFQRVT